MVAIDGERRRSPFFFLTNPAKGRSTKNTLWTFPGSYRARHAGAVAASPAVTDDRQIRDLLIKVNA